MVEMVGLKLELARLTGTSADLGVNEVLNERVIERLCSLDDSWELEEFVVGTGRQLCTYLDSIQHGDNNLQFLRLSAANGRRRPSPEIVKYLCKLANISQSFYRCISREQWLRTVVEWQNKNPVVEWQDKNPVAEWLNQNPAVEIRSNVVPQHAYLQRFEALRATCPGNGCSGGFSQASAVDQLRAPLFQTCTNCALAKQLRGGAKVDCGVVRFWFVEENEVELARDHPCLGEGSEGKAQKVLWRRGIFAQKLFKFAHNFENEVGVAFEVSHPSIVHCFGCARWDSADPYEYSLFMELLEEDLESHLQERDRGDTPELISFSDVLHILLQVAEAMEHLHRKNFVHGDLKPGNILLSQLTMPHSDVKFYLVKVTDFGCTQRMDPVSGAIKNFNAKIGTLCYVAPELLMCRVDGAPPPTYPHKLDVYSYAVLAYQVLTGATCSEVREGWTRRGVIKPDSDEDQWRPHKNLDHSTLEPDRMKLLDLVRKWWTSAPESRPSFTEICGEIRTLMGKADSPYDLIRSLKRKADSPPSNPCGLSNEEFQGLRQ